MRDTRMALRRVETRCLESLRCALGFVALWGALVGVAPTLAGSGVSAAVTVDTRIGASVTLLWIHGEQTIASESSREYQCRALFSNGTELDVTSETHWSVKATVLPAGTRMFGSSLQAGFVRSRQYVTLTATYAHPLSGETRTASLTVGIEPRFSTSFAQSLDYYNTTYWTVRLAAESSGPNGTASSYDWDLDGDGVFDDDHGASVSELLRAGRTHLVGLRATDAQGLQATAQRYITTPRGTWAFWSDPDVLAVDVVPGAYRDVDNGAYIPNPGRVNNGLVILTHGIFSSTDKTWIQEMGQAIVSRMSAAPPNVCLFDWRQMADPTLFTTGGRRTGVDQTVFRADDFLTIRSYGLAQGQVLANWIRGQIAAGNINADAPIHLVGHSAGGFVMGECARIRGSVISQVTMLDTPFPVKQQFVDYPKVGLVERYISSEYGRMCDQFRSDGDVVTTWRLDRVPTGPSYYRGQIADPLRTHEYAREWYTQTIQPGGLENGFHFSPLLDNGFHGESSSTAAASEAGTGLVTADAPPDDAPITGFQTFGAVGVSNGLYVITEDEDAGLVKQMTVPIGAQSLRFTFQFTSPGDGDFLAVYWGTNSPVLYIGLDLEISRDTFMEAEVPVSAFANQTGQLAFVLTSRGETNAVLELNQIRFSLSDDPDRDGLTTDEELALGTDPLNWDTDGDGLSDGDEVLVYGTDPLKWDTDGDGMSDGDEIGAGTDPKDRDSVLRITDMTVAQDGAVDLQWTGSTGRLYRVNRAQTLPPVAYTTLINSFPSNRFSTTSQSVGATNVAGFFWIQVDE